MALQTIASDVAADGVTANVSVTGPVSILVSGTMGTADLIVEVSDTGAAAWSQYTTLTSSVLPAAISCICTERTKCGFA